LGCPQQSLGHLLLVDDQNNKSFRSSLTWNDCTPTPSNFFILRNNHIRFRAMSESILLSSYHSHFSTEHHLDSETYIHNANIGEGRGGESEEERM